MKRLIVAADVDEALRDIYRYSIERWGERQARTYLEELRTAYFSLAREPLPGRPHRTVKGVKLRQLGAGRHVIVYTVRGDDVLVLGILHDAMNIPARAALLLQRMRRRGAI